MKKRSLLLLFVFSLVFCMINSKNICNAYTIAEYEEFIIYLKDNNITNGGNTIDYYNRVLSGLPNFKQYATSHNFINDNFIGIWAYWNSSMGYMEYNITKNQISFSTDNEYIYTTPQVQYNTYWERWGDNYNSYTGYFIGGSKSACLIEGEPTNRYI